MSTRESKRRSKKGTSEPAKPAKLTVQIDDDSEEKDAKVIFSNILQKVHKIKPKTTHQEEFIDLIKNHEITIALGPAGTGKSFMSVVMALEMLCDTNNKFKKISIITPAVEADEKLGFLPGGVDEKLEPFVDSTISLIKKVIGDRRTMKLIERGTIEVKALAYLRGANIDNTILIFEEAQNSSVKQMLTLLTRIGENSKFVISGDIRQSDRYKDGKDSGLFHAWNHLQHIHKIGFMEFVASDNVRNPLILQILEAWE